MHSVNVRTTSPSRCCATAPSSPPADAAERIRRRHLWVIKQSRLLGISLVDALINLRRRTRPRWRPHDLGIGRALSHFARLQRPGPIVRRMTRRPPPPRALRRRRSRRARRFFKSMHGNLEPPATGRLGVDAPASPVKPRHPPTRSISAERLPSCAWCASGDPRRIIAYVDGLTNSSSRHDPLPPVSRPTSSNRRWRPPSRIFNHRRITAARRYDPVQLSAARLCSTRGLHARRNKLWQYVLSVAQIGPVLTEHLVVLVGRQITRRS